MRDLQSKSLNKNNKPIKLSEFSKNQIDPPDGLDEASFLLVKKNQQKELENRIDLLAKDIEGFKQQQIQEIVGRIKNDISILNDFIKELEG